MSDDFWQTFDGCWSQLPLWGFLWPFNKINPGHLVCHQSQTSCNRASRTRGSHPRSDYHQIWRTGCDCHQMWWFLESGPSAITKSATFQRRLNLRMPSSVTLMFQPSCWTPNQWTCSWCIICIDNSSHLQLLPFSTDKHLEKVVSVPSNLMWHGRPTTQTSYWPRSSATHRKLESRWKCTRLTVHRLLFKNKELLSLNLVRMSRKKYYVDLSAVDSHDLGGIISRLQTHSFIETRSENCLLMGQMHDSPTAFQYISKQDRADA